VSGDALVLRDVSKRFGRKGTLALDRMSFRIPKGSIAGFVGPNGAGKTTTFSVVCGFLSPDEGEVDLLGEGPFDAHRLKGRVGVLPQDAELPDRHSPLELLGHLGRLQGMGRAEAAREAERLVELVRLGDKRDHRIAALSHGMRRRVAVASALCGSPELVILDEPLAGLDPSQAYSLRDNLAALRGQQTLVVSSHNLAEVERLCDWVVMVRDGRCVRQGPTVEMTGATAESRWSLGSVEGLDLATLGASLGEGVQLALEGSVLVVRSVGDAEALSVRLMAELAARGIALHGMVRGMGLERRFLADTGLSEPAAQG
jgi:ABC-type multidrug transport system ATPase subunit